MKKVLAKPARKMVAQFHPKRVLNRMVAKATMQKRKKPRT